MDKPLITKRLLSRAVLLYFLLAALFTGLLVVAYALPDATVMANASRTARALKPTSQLDAGLPREYRRDYFTDSLMMQLAADTSRRPVLYRAMANTLGADNVMWDKAQTAVNGYPRYWHGWLVTVRPLLLVGDINLISVLNVVLLSVLLIWCCALLWRCRGRVPALLFLLAVLVSGMPASGICLQFSACYFIVFITVILLLKYPPRNAGDMCLCAFAVGAVTVYFDLLTAPLLTFGLPAAVLLYNPGAKQSNLRLLLTLALWWCAGYALLWVTKWLIAMAVTGENIIGEALEQASYRSVGSMATYRPLQVWVLRKVALFAMAYAVCICAFAAICRGFRRLPSANAYLPVLALFPIVWIAVLSNHSAMHIWFVWRILTISLLSMGLYFFQALKIRKQQLIYHE